MAPKKRKASSASKKRSRGTKNAYVYFSMEQRSAVARREGLEEGASNFAEIAKALSIAWKNLKEADRAPYEACAAMDRSRQSIECLRGGALREAGDLSSAARDAVESLGQMPRSSLKCPAAAAEELLDSLEALDTRLTQAQRHAGAAAFRVPPASSLPRAASAGLGPVLGGRLTSLLKRWLAAPPPRANASTVRAPKPSKPAPPPGVPADLKDETRSRVIGMLMRTAARGAGKACFQRCTEVEEALFSRYDTDPKEYRRRARMLTHNLGSSDGALLHRVLDGTLDAKELVRLEAEELASDALKAERQRERERYFRSEVHDTAGPPKRRRDLLGLPRHKAEEEPASQPSQEGDEGNGNQAEQSVQATAEPGTRLDADVADVGSESSSSSSEDSDDGDDKDAIVEPIADAEPASGSGSQAQSAEVASGAGEESDEILARLMQMESPTGSSSSSSSRSSSPERPAEDLGAASSSSALTQGPELQRLQDMGFEAELAAAALFQAKGNVETAVAKLLKMSGG